MSLPFAPLEAGSALAQSVVDVVQAELVTPCGLRTLSPSDSAYRPRYEGDTGSRDGAYHEGTAWTWLLGPFAEAHYKVYKDRKQARAFLEPLQEQMKVYGVGSLAEIYGLTVDPADAATSLADFFAAKVTAALHVGDRLPLGAVALIAHEIHDGRVTTVGLQLAEPEPPQPRPRLLRRWRIALRKLKRLGR